jgi:hypothetical protein
VQLEGLSQLKNSVTSLGIEPAAFWLLAYASANYATAYAEFTHNEVKENFC